MFCLGNNVFGNDEFDYSCCESFSRNFVVDVIDVSMATWQDST